ncbi:MAG: hypothetical protein IT304_08900 [Dehalococcoidia bacterium]|nr:hypothetical protein [Dehalococcoidia bacterium]
MAVSRDRVRAAGPRKPLILRPVAPPAAADPHIRRAMNAARARGEASTAGFSLTLAFLLACVLVFLALSLL